MSSYVKITREYTKERKTFGRQTLFQSVPAEILDSINPSQEDQKMYGLRNPVNREVQAVATMAETEINTPPLVTHEQGINHLEGGWPKEVHPESEESTLRHRRRVMRDESYYETVLNISSAMEHCINQNNAIEMYETYFSNIPAQEPKENYVIRIANVFRDEYRRPVSCVKFTIEKNCKLAVAYCFKTCQSNSERNEWTDCYLWDIHKQSEPMLTFYPEHPCLQLECSPYSPDLMICGLENGTVHLFDIRAGNKSVSSSIFFNSHRESVTALRYIQSRSHTEFFSGSSDGQCLWWDSRNLSQPIDQLPMSVRIPQSEQPDLSNAEGVSYLEYDYGVPTRFLCGTESGLVINVNRAGKKLSDTLVSYWNAHNGPVHSIQRSVCTLRMFLTCGDYSVRIWSEEVRTAPIIVSNPYKYMVSDACWSPLRYSAYMSTCVGGYFYYWDLLRKNNEPVKCLQVSKHALTKMTAHKKGELVAVGNAKGSLYLVQLSENMTIPGPRDRILMQQMYERETRREHILDNRVKEMRLKALYTEDALNDHPVSVDDDDEDIRVTEDEYFRIVQEELKQIDISGDRDST